MNERQENIQNAINLASILSDYATTEDALNKARERFDEDPGHHSSLAYCVATEANSAALAKLKAAVETFPSDQHEGLWIYIRNRLAGL